MKAAVITVKGREEYLKPLLDIINNEIDVPVKIFMDTERNGHWWNLWRCMEYMLSNAEKDEPVLIMCDDVITIKGWKSYFEQIHQKAQNNIYTFMSRQRHLFNDENLKRGYITKCQKRGFYDHAVVYINHHDLMPKIKKWFNEIGKYTIPIKRQKHLDVVIQEYLIYKNISWTLTTPTLFNHIGSLSTFGKSHDIGESVQYIGK